MANIRISDMPPATLPLTGAELIELVQGGFSRQTDVDGVIAASASLQADFVTISANPDLANERILTAGVGISIVDSGAGFPVTINATPAAGLAAQFVTLVADANLANERVLTAGANISIVDSGAGGSITLNVTGLLLPVGTVDFSSLRWDNTGGVWVENTGLLLQGSSIFASEAAAALADQAGRGQFWVRDDVPNVPMFTDDAGTDFVLSAPSGTVPNGTIDGDTLYWDQTGGLGWLVTDRMTWLQASQTLQLGQNNRVILSGFADGGSGGQVLVTKGATSTLANAAFYSVGYSGDKYILAADSSSDADTFGIEWALFSSFGSERVNFRWGSFSGGNLPLSFQNNGSVHLNNGLHTFNDGSWYVTEMTVAQGDAAGRGQFWVRDDVPNVPMFTDDAGTDFVLNAVSAVSQLVDGGANVRVSAETLGVMQLRSVANTDTEVREINFTHQDGTLRAQLGHTLSSDVLVLNNLINNGPVQIRAQDGATPRIFITLTPTSSAQTIAFTGRSATVSFAVNDVALNDFGMGAKVADSGGTLRPVGMNVAPPETVNAAMTFALIDNGQMKIHDEGVNRVWTIDQSIDIPAGAIYGIININGAGTISLTPGAGVAFEYWNGTAFVNSTGVRTLGAGEYTIYKRSDIEYVVNGPNIT